MRHVEQEILETAQNILAGGGLTDEEYAELMERLKPAIAEELKRGHDVRQETERLMELLRANT